MCHEIDGKKSEMNNISYRQIIGFLFIYGSQLDLTYAYRTHAVNFLIQFNNNPDKHQLMNVVL